MRRFRMMNRADWLKLRNRFTGDLWSFIVWACIGWGATEMIVWLTAIPRPQVQTFFSGAFTMFVVLTLLGAWRYAQAEKLRHAAMDQFIADQKMDQDKQAKIDKEVIEKLQNEHNLSGTEQDRRLKSLEAALKHLRKK